MYTVICESSSSVAEIKVSHSLRNIAALLLERSVDLIDQIALPSAEINLRRAALRRNLLLDRQPDQQGFPR